MFEITLKFSEKDREKMLKAFSEEPDEFNDILKMRTDVYIKWMKKLRKEIKKEIKRINKIFNKN